MALSPAAAAVMANVLPSFISGASGLLGQGINFLSNKSTNKANAEINVQNAQLQKELQDRNLQFQTDMYERAQRDNSISAQAEQYRAAGLNPLMMMEKGTAFSPAQAMSGSSASAPSSIPMQAYQANFQGVSDAVNSYFNNRFTEEQAKGLAIQNDFKRSQLFLDIVDKIEELQHKKNLNSQDIETLKMLQSQARVLQKTEQYQISRQSSDAAYAEEAYQQMNWQNFWNKFSSNLDYKLKELEVKNASKDLQSKEAQIQAILSQVNLNKVSIKEASERIAGLLLQNEHNKQVYPLLRNEVRSNIMRNMHAGHLNFGPISVPYNLPGPDAAYYGDFLYPEPDGQPKKKPKRMAPVAYKNRP